MTNSFRESTFNCSTPLHYVVAKLFQIYENTQDESVEVSATDSSLFEKPRARVLPKSARTSFTFAPDTVSWLRACALDTALDTYNDNSLVKHSNQSTIYTLPLLGITNRPLAGYRKAGFNLYKTLVKLTIPADVRNFDQCTIEFSSRLPVNMSDFKNEMQRQVALTSSRSKRKGRLTFYSHGPSGIAAMTDLGALRLSSLKAMPAINIDWLDASANWETIWNPCANLEVIQSKLETRLNEFIDDLVSEVCASQCNAIMQSSGCFFDNVYLPHRKEKKLPRLNKVIFLPKSILQNNRSVDSFDAECNLLNYLSSGIGSGLDKKPRWIHKQVPTEDGWLPITM